MLVITLALAVPASASEDPFLKDSETLSPDFESDPDLNDSGSRDNPDALDESWDEYVGENDTWSAIDDDEDAAEDGSSDGNGEGDALAPASDDEPATTSSNAPARKSPLATGLGLGALLLAGVIGVVGRRYR